MADRCGDFGGVTGSGKPCSRPAGFGAPDSDDSGRCYQHIDRDEDRELTVIRQKFVDRYCVHGNGARAYREAVAPRTINHPDKLAHRLLKDPAVRKAIEDRMEQESLTATEVTARLSDHARGSLEPFLTPDGHLDLDTETARDAVHLLRKLKVKERRLDDGTVERRIELEVHDPQSALDKLAKIHGLYREDVEVTHRMLLVPDVDEVEGAA